jgi:bacterioferritin
MKGQKKILDILNALLADELTAINQYMVHSEMCANWEYGRLHEKIEKRAIDEMKHAEKLIARILFFDGTPIVSRLNPMHIGADVQKQLQYDLKAEAAAIKDYNAAVAEATRLKDNGTREMLESILKDEEDHIDWIEGQLDQMGQMGIQNYLAEQIKES